MGGGAWPFDQTPLVAAITTRFVLDRSRPILSVVHYSDDHSWAFLCDTTTNPDDGRVIAMSEALSLDPTIASVADLPPGWHAQRESVGGLWKRSPNTFELEQ